MTRINKTSGYGLMEEQGLFPDVIYKCSTLVFTLAWTKLTTNMIGSLSRKTCPHLTFLVHVRCTKMASTS